MDFRSFLMERINDEFHFLPEGCVGNEEGSSPSIMFVNNETPVTYTEPLTNVPTSQFAKNITDSGNAPLEKDEVILISRFVANKEKNRKVPTHASKDSSDPADPLDVNSDPDIYEFPSSKELKDFADYHWVITHVTPPSWKQHLKEISLDKLCDIHDKAYMWQVVLDNVMNQRTRELMPTLSKAKAACDAIEREKKIRIRHMLSLRLSLVMPPLVKVLRYQFPIKKKTMLKLWMSCLALVFLALMNESDMLRTFRFMLSHRCALKPIRSRPDSRQLTSWPGLLLKLPWQDERRSLKLACSKRQLYCSGIFEHVPCQHLYGVSLEVPSMSPSSVEEGSYELLQLWVI
nr:hypothetical protein [Tanacetum cinerariifolium]